MEIKGISVTIISASFSQLWRWLKAFIKPAPEAPLRRDRLFACLAVAALALPLCAGLLAWFGVFGQHKQRLAWEYAFTFLSIQPSNLPTPEVSVDFFIISPDGRKREGFANQDCRSGDRVELSARISHASFLMLFNWDGRQGRGFDDMIPTATYRSAVDFDIRVSALLDDSTGTEAFFAVASPLPFSYERDIKPQLEHRSLAGAKGVIPVISPLLLPDRFSVAHVYCQHAS